MKKFLLGTAALLAMATSASAADLAARPYTKAPVAVAQVMSWTGFYIGAQGGYGWGSSDEVFFNGANTAAFIGTQKYDVDGGFAGGVVGYNWQTGAFVLGIEGDYHWSDISGRSGVINVGPPNVGDTYFTKLRGFGDVKGRLGYAAGPALFFVSGGAAVGDLQHRYDGVPGNVFVQNETRWGYNESAPASNTCSRRTGAASSRTTTSISARARSSTPPWLQNCSEWNDTFHTVKAGINYHFNMGGPAVARY